MKRIRNVIMILVIGIIGCKDDDKSLVISFNDKDYKLLETKKYDWGNKYSEEFISKKDKNFRLKKIYWENGKIQSVTFFSNNKKIGPNQFYDTSANLLYEGFYYSDKENGIVIQYDVQSKKAKIETFKNGNVINQTNIE